MGGKGTAGKEWRSGLPDLRDPGERGPGHLCPGSPSLAAWLCRGKRLTGIQPWVALPDLSSGASSRGPCMHSHRVPQNHSQRPLHVPIFTGGKGPWLSRESAFHSISLGLTPEPGASGSGVFLRVTYQAECSPGLCHGPQGHQLGHQCLIYRSHNSAQGHKVRF